jgi:hypothetical protein
VSEERLNRFSYLGWIRLFHKVLLDSLGRLRAPPKCPRRMGNRGMFPSYHDCRKMVRVGINLQPRLEKDFFTPEKCLVHLLMHHGVLAKVRITT